MYNKSLVVQYASYGISCKTIIVYGQFMESDFSNERVENKGTLFRTNWNFEVTRSKVTIAEKKEGWGKFHTRNFRKKKTFRSRWHVPMIGNRKSLRRAEERQRSIGNNSETVYVAHGREFRPDASHGF